LQRHEFPLLAARLFPDRQDLLGRGDVESLGERGRHRDAERLRDDLSPGFQRVSPAFGRLVQGMGPVEPSQISGLGFMLSDKKPGAFQISLSTSASF